MYLPNDTKQSLVVVGIPMPSLPLSRALKSHNLNKQQGGNLGRGRIHWRRPYPSTRCNQAFWRPLTFCILPSPHSTLAAAQPTITAQDTTVPERTDDDPQANADRPTCGTARELSSCQQKLSMRGFL